MFRALAVRASSPETNTELPYAQQSPRGVHSQGAEGGVHGWKEQGEDVLWTAGSIELLQEGTRHPGWMRGGDEESLVLCGFEGKRALRTLGAQDSLSFCPPGGGGFQACRLSSLYFHAL